MRPALLVFGALVGVFACDLGARTLPPEPGPAATVLVDEPEAAGTRAAVLEPGSGARHVGTLVARESVDVPARIEGVIATVEVGIGDRIRVGDPIAIIDAQPIREQLAIGRASARAAAAQVDRARADLAEAERRYQRRLSLSNQLAPEEIENARFAAERARAVLTGATAAVSEHQARVSQLERALRETVITAPFSGTVSIRYADPGALVARGAPVVRLIASDDLLVRFAVPADEKASYALGDRIDVVLEPDQKAIVAVVRRIAPDLDPVTQMVLAEAELADEPDARAPAQAGMAAWVRPRRQAPPSFRP